MSLVHPTHLQCCLESEATLCLREEGKNKKSKYGHIIKVFMCALQTHNRRELFEWLVVQYGRSALFGSEPLK